MRKKKTIIIVVLLLINVLMFGVKTYFNNELMKVDNIISEKESEIRNNESEIDLLKSSKEDAISNNLLVEKEYKVWVHQNEKLENILQ